MTKYKKSKSSIFGSITIGLIVASILIGWFIYMVGYSVSSEPTQARSQSTQKENSEDASAIIVAGGIVLVIIIVIYVCGSCNENKSPWHLETLPDGQQVWVREQQTSWFFFWW